MRTQKSNFFQGLLLAGLWLGMHTSPAVAADGDQYLGKWSGTYRGDNSSGHFELNLARGATGALTGSITVADDAGSGSGYTANLKSVSFDGDNFAAAYEPPGDNQGEVRLKGIFGPKGADGDWSLGAKDQPTSSASITGTWKILRP
jgi:hypothetical protein